MESSYEAEMNNGEPSVVNNEQEDMYSSDKKTQNHFEKGLDASSVSLYDAVSALLLPIFFLDPHSSLAASSVLRRAKVSFRDNLPQLREASRASGLRLLRWARRGSPLRLLLVISVGIITLLFLTGVLVFFLFLGAATVNAVIISLFVSLAAAGGCLAIFFACVAAIYIGALFIAVFVICSAIISAVIAVLIVTGWIGFFWTLWMAMRKSARLVKHTVTMTGSALSAYTSAWHTHRHSHHHHN